MEKLGIPNMQFLSITLNKITFIIVSKISIWIVSSPSSW